MIDELVYLENHDPSWGQSFIQEQERIRATLHLDLTAIQHIGSTAVFGIYAKPIIDIMIGIETFPPSQHLSNSTYQMDWLASVMTRWVKQVCQSGYTSGIADCNYSMCMSLNEKNSIGTPI
jgi:GrpB-like predicted nucleotidyltransferase (UPF0157 family)